MTADRPETRWLVAALHRHAIAEARGSGHGGGSNAHIHLAAALAGHGREGAKTTPLLGIQGEVVIDQLEVAAIGEAQEHRQGEGAAARGDGLEIHPIAAEGAIHRKVGVPVGATHQAARADALLHRRLAATADGHQEAALGASDAGDGAKQKGETKKEGATTVDWRAGHGLRRRVGGKEPLATYPAGAAAKGIGLEKMQGVPSRAVPMTPNPLPGDPALGTLRLRPLFPLALGELQLAPDPLETAVLLQEILRMRGGATSNPTEGCAWTGDLHGQDQLHRHPAFAPLLERLAEAAARYVAAVGFDRARVALHLQRAWPVVSEEGQGIGRHHHPNAHLSGVYYLTGDGLGASGCLRMWAPRQDNELVPGLAVGHGGPIVATSAEARAWNAPWWDVAPRAGLLLLFPASVEHGVCDNGSAEERRVSIAMDFCLTAPARQGVDAATAEGGEETTGAAEYLAPHPGSWLEVAQRT